MSNYIVFLYRIIYNISGGINMNDKYIIYFISRTRKKMLRFLEHKLTEHGMNDIITSHGNILTALYNNGGKLAMNKIAKIIGKDKSTVTPLINKLLQLGYIEKVQDETDKRITYIVLSEQGRMLKPKFDAISAQINETAYKGFTEEEKGTFLRLLKKLNTNFTEGQEE